MLQREVFGASTAKPEVFKMMSGLSTLPSWSIGVWKVKDVDPALAEIMQRLKTIRVGAMAHHE
jgi:hypothetical protein